MRPNGVHPLYYSISRYQPPPDWTFHAINDCASIVKGKLPSLLLKHPTAYSLPYLLINGLDDGEETLYTEETHLPLIDVKDTVIVADGSRSGLAIRGVSGVLGSTLLAYRAKNGINHDYLFYILESLYPYNNSATIGGAIPHLDKRLLSKLVLAIPKEDEQTRIATVLKMADDSIAKVRAELMAVRELKQSILHSLFSVGLYRPEGLHRSKWITYPAHWHTKLLRHFAEITSGFTMGRDLSRHETVTIPYVTVINVQDGRFQLDNIGSIEIKTSEMDTDTLRYGDILMTEGGDRDKLGRGGMWRNEIKPCSYQNHIFRVRLNCDEYRPELFHYLIQTYQTKRYFFAHAKQTSNLCTINSRELKNWPIPIPPINEQMQMIEILQAADNQEICVQKKISSLQQVKKSLLQNLLTGKIRICEEIGYE